MRYTNDTPENLSCPGLTPAQQLEWLYEHKEWLLQAGANIKITRSGNTTTIEAVGEGFSPTVSVETIPGGHRVTITDGEGEHVFDVMDGQDGADGTDGSDGTSVTFTTASITGGTRVTLTDGDHSSSFDVMNGTDGEDITITDVTVISSGTQVTFSDDTVIVIPNGLTGPQGVPGVNGRNVFIKYADAQPTQDSDMKDLPSAFMGVYSGTATTAPTTFTDYLWYQIKGAKGDTGNTGATGQDGVSPTLSAEPISGGHRVTMTDAQGTTTFDVMDGENAAAATVTVGTTTTGAPGTSASVTNSGTSSAAVLDFVIPRGNAGPAGSNGANVFVKYAANQPSQDSDMKDTIDEWIGIYAGTETTPPTTYTSYQWYKIKGYDGISPTVTVTQLVNGYHVEIVSAGGTESFDLYNGADGADGQGVPTGGTAGQILAKVNATNYNTKWIDPPSGGGDIDEWVDVTAAGGFTSVSMDLYAAGQASALTTLTSNSYSHTVYMKPVKVGNRTLHAVRIRGPIDIGSTQSYTNVARAILKLGNGSFYQYQYKGETYYVTTSDLFSGPSSFSIRNSNSFKNVNGSGSIINDPDWGFRGQKLEFNLYVAFPANGFGGQLTNLLYLE